MPRFPRYVADSRNANERRDGPFRLSVAAGVGVTRSRRRIAKLQPLKQFDERLLAPQAPRGITNKKRPRGPALAGPLQSEPNLFGVDEKGEGVGDDARARMRIVRSGSGRRAEVGGDEIDVVVGVVEGHGASAALCVDFFYERKLGG